MFNMPELVFVFVYIFNVKYHPGGMMLYLLLLSFCVIHLMMYIHGWSWKAGLKAISARFSVFLLGHGLFQSWQRFIREFFIVSFPEGGEPSQKVWKENVQENPNRKQLNLEFIVLNRKSQKQLLQIPNVWMGMLGTLLWKQATQELH